MQHSKHDATVKKQIIAIAFSAVLRRGKKMYVTVTILEGSPLHASLRRELHDDFVGPHHLIVLMLKDVTMPDVEEFLPWGYRRTVRQVKAHDDSSNIAGIGLDRILMSRSFVAFGRHWFGSEDEFAGLLVGWYVEGLSIQYLELHKVDMQGMNVACDVHEGPDFGAASFGIFGDWLMPSGVAQQAH